MPSYRNLAIGAICICAIAYSFISPVTNDTYSHASMIIDGSGDYPPLLHYLVKVPLLVVGFNYSNAVAFTFLIGSVLTLVILPYFIFKMFEEYKNSSRTAFLGLIAYLFGTGVTNYLYYANVWAQSLAMIFIVITITCLMKKETMKASLFVALTFLAHREMCWYALVILIAYFVISRKQIEQIYSGAAYCLSKSGEITRSLSCYLPIFLIVYPFIWLPTLRNAAWKTVNDKLYVVSSLAPLMFVFIDLRVFLATFTFWSLYVGEEMLKSKKRLVLILLISALFASFSFFYTLDLATTAIS